MTATDQQRAEAVLNSDLTDFVSKLIEGAVKAGSDPKTCKFEPKEGVLQIGESQLVVSSLYTLFTEQCTDKARETFIDNVIKTATGKANMPGTLSEAAGLLMPQIYGEQKIREKQANLGKAAVLPYHTLDGSDRLLSSGDVAICVVADFGHATVPVLSATLKQWDCNFNDVLQIAVTNLVTKNEKLATSAGDSKSKGRKGKGKKSAKPCTWEMHPSGCGSSTWHDQYDSTRVALFPRILQNRDKNAEKDGDIVCLFGANQQCLVAGACNPIACCFMGDMCLDIAKTRDLISNQPHRLIAVPVSDKMPAASPGHPLHKLLTTGLEEGSIYKWVRYEPVAAKGEFSVPEDQGEIDAVLAAVQSGKQIPVFRREKPAAQTSAKPAKKPAFDPNAKWVGFKEKGSEFFKAKDYKRAEEWWTKALDAHAKEETDETEQRGAIFSNRSAARLSMGLAAAALDDGESAVRLRPTWPKGYFRAAKAFEGLRRYAEAAESYTCAAAATMAAIDLTTKNGKSKGAKEAKRLELQAREAKDCAARHTVMAQTPPRPTRAKVRQLLAEALGWEDGVKTNGSGVPGWMPVDVQDTPSARLAITTLYSMLRDRRVTERDRKSEPCSSYCYCYKEGSSGSGSDTDECKDSSPNSHKECSSPRRPASPPAKVRGAVLRELAEAGGERTMIVMVMGMQAATAADSGNKAFDTPLEKRSLLQLVESILEVAELKAATVQFKKLMSEDSDCAALLGDAMKQKQAPVAPAPKAPKAAKKESCCKKGACAERQQPTEPTAVPKQPRKNSKKENDPAQPVQEKKKKPAATKKKAAKPASQTITLDSSTLMSLGSGFGKSDWKGTGGAGSEFVVGNSTGGMPGFPTTTSSSTWSPFGSSSGNQRGLL